MKIKILHGLEGAKKAMRNFLITTPLIFCLSIGIIFPFSYPTMIVNAIILGLVCARVLPYRKFAYAFLIFTILYSSILYIHSGISMTVTGILSFLTVHYFSQRLSMKGRQFVLIVLGLMSFGMFIIFFSDGNTLAEYMRVPPEYFKSDMDSYLNTFYLQKEGLGFYDSFASSIKMFQEGNYPTELWAWKQPLIFYLWYLLPGNGISIVYLAAGFFSLDLIAAFFIARKFLPPAKAILSPLILLPYFHYPLTVKTVLQVEWWALSFFIWGITAVLYRRYLGAGILFAICLAIRTLFAIPIAFIVAIPLFSGKIKDTAKIMFTTLIIFIPYYFLLHFKNISRYVDLNSLLNNSLRNASDHGWHLVRTTLAYSSWNYGVFPIRPFLVLIILTSLLLILLCMKNNNKKPYLILLASYLPFFILEFRLPMLDIWHDYWGIYYIPLLLIASSIALLSKFKTK